MTFHDAEQFLLSLSNIPRPKDRQHTPMVLKRMHHILSLLDHPERKIPHYIHVGGTSGKGSVATFLHHILLADGTRVGTLTSPHHTKITERWTVGRQTMSPTVFARIVEELKTPLSDYLRTSRYGMLSYVELTTVIGLYYFAQQKVDWAVIEVGCGGTYDSTNIIPWKDAAIITNVGLDHVDILGRTKTAIAKEKSGIITKGTAVFTMDTDPKVLRLLEAACATTEALLTTMTKPPHSTNNGWSGQTFQYHGEACPLSAFGEHQAANAYLCAMVAEYLGIQQNIIRTGLAAAKQPLRMEIVSTHPVIIVDGAHNREKMETTVRTIQSLRKNNQDIHLIIGFSEEKPQRAMLRELKQLHPRSIACTRNTVNPFRKVSHPAALARACTSLLPTATVQAFLDPNDAYAWSTVQMKQNDILLVTGSIFLSGEIKKCV
ncbi:MAG TPA: Mur ligase family protein [Candidatus Kapabacteria bacterium]|nr:Mur ligase family protein [Candidatus Kapabacteria bacterium]